MRRSSMLSAFAVASLAVAAGLEVIRQTPTHGTGRRTYGRSMIGFPANINRHTGKPHEHKREMARRVRQQKGN